MSLMRRKHPVIPGESRSDRERRLSRERRARMTPEQKAARNAYILEWQRQHPEKTRAAVRGWQKRNPTALAIAYRKHKLKKQYGLTPEAVVSIYENQEGLCAICSRLMTLGGKGKDRVCIDHDHTTGKVRGMLCTGCNTAIGHMRDKPYILRNAAGYLEDAAKAA